MKLTAIVLTRDEEAEIANCVGSLKFCNEVIIVDDFSSDKTVSIAKKLDAKVIKRRLNDDFASQRNFALAKAKGKWVLFLDADEMITKSLASEIVSAVDEPSNYQGYRLKRHDIVWGKELAHGEVGKVRLLRLARKGAGKWERRVHETWNVNGKIGYLQNPIIHRPHKTLSKFIDNINYYSRIHAEQHLEDGKRSNTCKIIVWPALKFIDSFAIKAGVLDGVQGLLFSVLMSFHSFLAWSTLWLIQKRK